MFVLPTSTKPASRIRRVTKRVVARHEVAEHVRPHRVGHAGDRGRVLDRDRDAGKRPRIVPADLRGGLERALGVDVNERIEAGLELLDALERSRDQLGRADLPAVNERGELAGRPEEKVVRPRVASSLPASV